MILRARIDVSEHLEVDLCQKTGLEDSNWFSAGQSPVRGRFSGGGLFPGKDKDRPPSPSRARLSAPVFLRFDHRAAASL